jgi:hypothetical protein
MTRTFHGKQLKVGGAVYTVNEVKGLRPQSIHVRQRRFLRLYHSN